MKFSHLCKYLRQCVLPGVNTQVHIGVAHMYHATYVCMYAKQTRVDVCERFSALNILLRSGR